jgi:hypothetical protein
MQDAEAMLERGKSNLLSMDTAEQIAAQQGTIVDAIKAIPHLDPEDLAVVLNRWKTAQLERQRDIAKRSKRR